MKFRPADYPDVVSTLNLKGGVGKTTLAVNLAYALAWYHGKRVLIVDLDPQANATQYLISEQAYRKTFLEQAHRKSTVAELYAELNAKESLVQDRDHDVVVADPEQYIQNIVRDPQRGRLDVIASKLELGLLAFEGGNVLKTHWLMHFLLQVRASYDIVIVDCPPTVSLMLVAALQASEHVLIPMKPEFLSTIGLPLLHRVLQDIYPRLCYRSSWLEPLAVLGVALTMVQRNLVMTRQSIEEITRQAGAYDYPMFGSYMSHTTRLAWSSKQRLPVFRTDPQSTYAEEVRSMASEFLTRMAEAKAQPIPRGS